MVERLKKVEKEALDAIHSGLSVATEEAILEFFHMAGEAIKSHLTAGDVDPSTRQQVGQVVSSMQGVVAKVRENAEAGTTPTTTKSKKEARKLS